MISNLDQRPAGAVDYMQGSNGGRYGNAGGLAQRDGYLQGGHQYARGVALSAQS